MEKAQQAREENDKGAMKDSASLLATNYIQEYMDKRYVQMLDGFATTYANAGAYAKAQFPNATEGGFTYAVSGNTLTVSDVKGNTISGTIEDNGTITWGDETAVTPDSQEPETSVATIPEKLHVEVNNNGMITYRKIYVNYTFPGDSTATTCVVMYSDAEHGLQIIPEDPMVKVKLGKTDNIGGATGTTDLAKAQNSYQNAVVNLNEKAKLLAGVSTTQTKVTTNLAQDARCVGSLPDVNAEKTEFSKEDEQIKYVTTEGVTSQVAVGKFTSTYFTSSYDGQYWDTDENYKEDETRLKAIGAYGFSSKTNGSYYVLASRSVASGDSVSVFNMRRVDSKGSLNSGDKLWSVYPDGTANKYNLERGFRPVILLKSGIQVKDEDGRDGTTAEKAYNLE